MDERRRNGGHDCIPTAMEQTHSFGYPMSQRENAGFNWPALAVFAVDPDGRVPETSGTVSFVRAGRPIVTFVPSGIIPVDETPLRGPFPPFPSLAAGLNHAEGANVKACSDSGLPRTCSKRPARNSGEPEALWKSRALGVAQGDAEL